MLTAFTLKNGHLEQCRIHTAEDLSPETIWIDMVNPSEEERSLIEVFYGFELPEKTEIKDIEASARFYEDEDGIHIHSFFLDDFEEEASNITVAFSIFGGRLFTLHEEELSSFRLYRLRARRMNTEILDAMDIVIGLHETAVEHVADVLEGIYAQLEEVSRHVLKRSSEEIATHQKSKKDAESHDRIHDISTILAEIASQEDKNGKARLSLMDTRRSLSFLLRERLLKPEQTENVREILRDLESLTGHTSFLFDKVNFLLNTTMGIISIEQSKIIKIFSIASVVFLPPTVVASIYGMNFVDMPELSMSYGYPLALVGMFMSAIAPYWFFKRKGWL